MCHAGAQLKMKRKPRSRGDKRSRDSAVALPRWFGASKNWESRLTSLKELEAEFNEFKSSCRERIETEEGWQRFDFLMRRAIIEAGVDLSLDLPQCAKSGYDAHQDPPPPWVEDWFYLHFNRAADRRASSDGATHAVDVMRGLLRVYKREAEGILKRGFGLSLKRPFRPSRLSFFLTFGPRGEILINGKVFYSGRAVRQLRILGNLHERLAAAIKSGEPNRAFASAKEACKGRDLEQASTDIARLRRELVSKCKRLLGWLVEDNDLIEYVTGRYRLHPQNVTLEFIAENRMQENTDRMSGEDTAELL